MILSKIRIKHIETQSLDDTIIIFYDDTDCVSTSNKNLLLYTYNILNELTSDNNIVLDGISINALKQFYKTEEEFNKLERQKARENNIHINKIPIALSTGEKDKRYNYKLFI